MFSISHIAHPIHFQLKWNAKKLVFALDTNQKQAFDEFKHRLCSETICKTTLYVHLKKVLGDSAKDLHLPRNVRD
jgi:hypothetical protein